MPTKMVFLLPRSGHTLIKRRKTDEAAKVEFAVGIATLVAMALLPAAALAQDYSDVQSNGPLNLKGYRNFFIQARSLHAQPHPTSHQNAALGPLIQGCT